MMNEAFKLAVEEFKKIDLKSTLEKSGAILKTIDSRETIALTYLNQEYFIFLPEVEITYSGSKKEVSLREKIIILHYLNKSKGTQLSGKWIDFRDVPEGNNYYSVFEGRVYKPFLRAFGERPHLFLESAQSLKGKRADFADFSVIIPVFPKVSVSLLIYKGDEEFPPAGKALFDFNIKDYLPTEDVVIVCEDLVKKLIRVIND